MTRQAEVTVITLSRDDLRDLVRAEVEAALEASRPADIMPEKLLSISELAEVLGASRATVNRLRRLEGFPSLKLIDSHRFRASDVVRFLRAREMEGGH